jgi:hypothetical protein
MVVYLSPFGQLFVYFMSLWCIFAHLVKLHREKSGSPGLDRDLIPILKNGTERPKMLVFFLGGSLRPFSAL